MPEKGFSFLVLTSEWNYMKRNSFPRTGQELESTAIKLAADVFGVDLHPLSNVERVSACVQMRDVVIERRKPIMFESLKTGSLHTDPRVRALMNQIYVLEAYLLETAAKTGNSPEDVSQLLSKNSKEPITMALYFE
jgi:hypothetical protein